MEESSKFKWIFDGLEVLKERYVGEPKAIEALEAVKLWINGVETVETIDLYRWDGQKHVLAATMTVEEAKAFDLAMREKARARNLAMQEKSKKTQARMRRIKKIVWENRFESLEDVLSYLVDGGEEMAELLEYMDKDEDRWKYEIKCARDGCGSKKGWKEQLSDQNHGEAEGRLNSTPPKELRPELLAEIKKLDTRHVEAFRGRLRNRGYTQIHIKQTTKPGIYLVKAVEPLAGTETQIELGLDDMKRAMRYLWE